MSKKSIIKACDVVGGQAALARALGLKSQGSVSNWISRERVPPEWVIPIEQLTGVRRHELRPDLYPPKSAA